MLHRGNRFGVLELEAKKVRGHVEGGADARRSKPLATSSIISRAATAHEAGRHRLPGRILSE